MGKDPMVFGNKLQTGWMWDSLKRSLTKKIGYSLSFDFKGLLLFPSKKSVLINVR
jgi:hypothetical protein